MNLDIIQLNELNFDLVQRYIARGENLPAFERILTDIKTTESEKSYDCLEPWIQWASFYTGKSYDGHKIFRLGDFDRYKGDTILDFWDPDATVCVSPMNLTQKGSSSVFIPDPWTNTKVSGGIRIKWVYDAVRSFVNNNTSGKVARSSYIKLGIGLLGILSVRQMFDLANAMVNLRGEKYRKAILLDKILFKLFTKFTANHKNHRGILFLNAGAHIQHHYLQNSLAEFGEGEKNPDWYLSTDLDPFLEVVKEYEQILSEQLSKTSTNTLIVTGLSQKAYPKPKLYWRLTNHEKFLKHVGIEFASVNTRMSRDFKIKFESHEQLVKGKTRLEQIKDTADNFVFGDFENNGLSLFVTLKYPGDVNSYKFFLDETPISLQNFVDLVAIKNGEHRSLGFWYFNGEDIDIKPEKITHIWDFFDTLKELESKSEKGK